MTHLIRCTAQALIVVLVFLARPAVAADAAEFSGFLTDYSQLEPVSSVEYADYVYVVPDIDKRTADYVGVVIPQPVIFIAPDSKYKGIQPDDMKVLADAFRGVLISELEGKIPIMMSGGPRILELQVALSNVYLAKHKRSLLGYLPVALVVSGARQALLNDITKKIDLTGLTIEGQLLDSVNVERFGAYINREGARKQTKDFGSWDELEVILRVAGRRLACRYENSKVPADQRQDCLAITAADLD